MALRERIYEKSQGLVKREAVLLPECGERVIVRTLMSGDLLRANAMSPEKQGLAIFAFATEDPDRPGAPIYNFNLQEDQQFLAALHPNDVSEVVKVHNRLLGIASEEAEGNLPATGSFSISSPSGTESSPLSLEAA